MSTPLRVVLDTNVLLVSFSESSPLHWAFQAVASGQATLCLSTGIALEYEEVVAAHMGREVADALTSFLDGTPFVSWTHTRYRWRLVSGDPDDDKFADCAVAAGATIVTEDRHFDVLRGVDFPPVRVVGINGFRRLLEETRP